jgi:hypothetical protein
VYGGRHIGNGVKASTAVCSILIISDLPNKLHSIIADADHEMKPAWMDVSGAVRGWVWVGGG